MQGTEEIIFGVPATLRNNFRDPFHGLVLAYREQTSDVQIKQAIRLSCLMSKISGIYYSNNKNQMLLINTF